LDILHRIRMKNPLLPVIALARPENRKIADMAVGKGAFSYIVQSGSVRDVAISLKQEFCKYREKTSHGRCDILVIDDDKDISEMVKTYLASNGYLCRAINDSGKAISGVISCKPKLIFLDIVMPGIDGMELLDYIRKTDPEIKIIMMSGVSDQDICINAVKKGASGYITKPFSLQQLKVTLVTALFT
jgi:DNA-binding NtrC family response regulator